MESHGQDILDMMDEAGESPREVSDKFWNETYFALPAPVQQRFTRMLKNISGLEPGDTIAVRPDKSGIVAKDWADVANGLLPEKVEHLEGTERGLTALMKEANDRFSNAHNSAQHGREQPRPLMGPRPVLQALNPAERASGSLQRAQSAPIVMPVRPARTTGLAPARSLTGPVQAKVLQNASPAQFETAQGSTYAVNGQSTTRNKSQHAGHDPQDMGLKEPSEKTVYVDPKLATEIGAWNTLSAGGKRIRIAGDQIQLLSKNPRTGQLGIDRTINNPAFTTAPELGKSPLELWKSDERGMYASNHPGNAIVRISSGNEKLTAKEPGSVQSQAALAKGDQVTLPDGSTGTVSYVDPAMRIARIRASDGRNVTARLSALKQSDGVKQSRRNSTQRAH